MDRRDFLSRSAVTAAVATTGAIFPRDAVAAPTLKPMALGMVIVPYGAAEEKFRLLHDMGFDNCFLSLDGYLDRQASGGFTPQLADLFRSLMEKYQVQVTTVEVVGPQPLVWDFAHGPSTIGLVPRATREARMDALRRVSDFGHLLGVEQVQTHCGFIPEDPANPLYAETVEAIRAVADHCHGNDQYFLMETGQETPTTMSRMIHDVARHNLGVGLDTANLILYGKANPVDAVAILGPHVRSIHAKDGRWPTDPMQLGEEVVIGQGLVNFREVFRGLRRVGYTGAVSIEREISGPQQVADVRREKEYLEAILGS